MDDLPWDGHSRKLVEIALAHGVGVSSAHRALTDVDVMARLLTRLRERGADLPALFRRAARPKALFYAVVPYERRQVAKDHGFRWDEAKHGKNWFRTMPVEDAAALPFPVRRVA
jgi:DNA polymerase-3 subunit epsilon